MRRKISVRNQKRNMKTDRNILVNEDQYELKVKDKPHSSVTEKENYLYIVLIYFKIKKFPDFQRCVHG